MGFGAYGVGPYGFCGCWGSLYKHRRITLGKNFAYGSCLSLFMKGQPIWFAIELLSVAFHTSSSSSSFSY